MTTASILTPPASTSTSALAAAAPPLAVSPRRYDPRAFGARCDECPCRLRYGDDEERWLRSVVPTEWRPGRTLILAREPGPDEERAGHPMAGRTGEELDRTVEHNGLRREDFSIGNVRDCRLPGAEWRPEDDVAAFAACRPRLQWEIEHSPAVIALGAEAADAVFGSGVRRRRAGGDDGGGGDAEGGFAYLRGFPVRINPRGGLIRSSVAAAGSADNIAVGAGKPALMSWNPAFVLRKPRWTGEFRKHVGKAVRHAAGQLRWRDPTVIYDPTPDEFDAALGRLSGWVAVDIETDGKDPLTAQMRCAGLGSAELAVIGAMRSINGLAGHVIDRPGAPARPARCAPGFVRERVANFIARYPHLTGHNVNVFDRTGLDLAGMPLPPPERIFDTIGAAHVLHPELARSLESQASSHTDSPKWKPPHKHDAWTNDRDLQVYCGYDCSVDAIVASTLHAQMQTAGDWAWRVWASDVGMQRGAVAMHEAGIYYDQAERARHAARLKAKMLDAQARAVTASGRDINLGSPPQVARYLFSDLQLAETEYQTDAGEPSTGIDALNEILMRALPARVVAWIDALVDYRRAQGWLTKYVTGSEDKPLVFDAAGRLHPSWNGTGVVSGRYAANDPPMQQLPGTKHDVDSLRSMICAAPGNVLVYGDLEQVEIRIITLLTHDEMWTRAFAQGLDVHCLNAVTFFPGVRYEDLVAAKKAGIDTFERDFAKNFTYLLFYGGEAEIACALMRKVRHPKTGRRPYANFTVDQARLKRDQFLRDHPGLPLYWESTVASWRQAGYLATAILGRRRPFLDAHYSGRDGEQKYYNEMLNFPVQGLVGDLMGGSGAVGRILAEVPPGLYGPGLIFHGHDSMMLEVEERYADTAAAKLTTAMTTQVGAMPIPAKVRVGRVWSQLG